MSRTITGTAGTLVTLSAVGDNPATVAYNAVLQAGLYGEGTTAWTVTNFGTIRNSGTLFAVTLNDGGTLSNAAAGVISASSGVEILGAAGTVTNAGSILGGPGVGVSLADGGFVTNASGAHIGAGQRGVVITGAEGTVINSGIILTSATGAKGVYLYEGGQVTNQAGATISAYAAVKFAVTGAGTVTNAGSIYGINNGVYLRDGGTIANLAGATITSGGRGVNVNGSGAGTVTNAGVIGGTVAAVRFGAGYADRLIVDPGASFNGSVYGGNSIGSTIVSSLELATGSSAGTLSSLGSQVTLFGNVSIDSGASWTLTADTIGSGYTITDNGALTNTGTLGSTVTVGNGAVLTNAFGASVSAASAVGSVYLKGTAGTLLNSGNITATGTYGGVLGAAAGAYVSNASGGTITGFKAVSLSSGTVVNTGVIKSSATTGSSAGVIVVSGTISNAAGGTISGGRAAVYLGNSLGGSGTLINSGLVSGISYGVSNKRESERVTNLSGGTITGATGVYVQGTLSNAGLIIGTSNSGVNLRPGALTNLATGTIMSQGASGKAVFANNVATIINAGLISDTKASGIGILLQQGGLVTNQSGGTIAGGLYGVKVYNTAATVTNAGSISGGTDAVLFVAGIAGRVIVDPGAAFAGTVNGGNTIGSTAVSTLELASGASVGTLSGLGSKYINFARTTIDAGATWMLSSASFASGISLTNAGTLALSGATLTDAGTLTNNGVILVDPSTLIAGGLVGSGSVTIEAASTVVVSGTVAAGETIDFSASSGAFYVTPGSGNFGGLIDGFRTGNTIGLTGISDASSATIVSGNTLAVTTGSEGIIDLRMDPSQSFTGATFNVVESGGNALITANNLACFVAGTLLDTPQGPMAVESLSTGDLIATSSGAVRPVRWIGQRHLDPSRHPTPARAQPIRIAAGAIAHGLPRRDLLVSPDHALLLDDMLIIARLLLNGASIRQEAWRSVTYFHVELDAHDILLAEGLPAESYLDTGNRGMFENASLPLALHPKFETNDQARRVAESCAPLVDDPAVVEPIWRRLAARAETLGWAMPELPPVTDDPALCVVQNGRRISPAVVRDGHYTFALPAGVLRASGAARLVSRHAVPSLLRPWIEDNRRLGVMVRRLTLHRGTEVITLPLDHPALDDGWWAVEHHGRTMSRWTDGDGALPLPDHEGTVILEVELAGTVPYPASADARRPVAPAVTDAALRTAAA